jgi:UDP-N-acetylmuramate dehydrogenase
MHAVAAEAVERAASVLGDLAERHVSLAPMTTYKVGGAAELFVRVRHVDDLRRVADAMRASELPVLAIGRGSNLLVSEAGFVGIAISLVEIAEQVRVDDHVVEVGSAVLLPVLARQLANSGLTGFEWAVGVPGSIGGAVRMNAGGHGSDMAASLLDVRVFDLVTSTEQVLTPDQLGLRFRGSGLPPTTVVLSARLAVVPGDPDEARAELSAIVSWRRANQPGGQNAGSVFVNPVPGEVSAGQLIDRVGLRGFRHGTAVVSDKHANFIQADPDGRADDVFELMAIVRRRVEAATGYSLRSEIRLVGFDRTDA